ncbi:hypothetical protein PTKIN_Ptkin15bG0062900 [Pterospermum kingtungense]
MNCWRQWKPVVAMIAINFALAITNVLIKKTLDEGVSHIIILMYRQAISAVSLAPIAFFRESLEKVNIKNNAGRAKVLGTLVCIGGGMVLTLYKGEKLVRSNSRAATTHITNYANTMASTKKKEIRWAIGSILLAAGCIFWSSWFLLQARIGKTYPCQYSSTALLSFFSAIQSAILSLITERDFTKWILKEKLELITVTYSGMVASGLCYAGMSWCVKQKGPVFTSAFTPLVQLFVAMFDFSILHGHIYFGSVTGSILVVIGLYTLLWGRNSEEEETRRLQQPQVKEEDCTATSQV